MIDPTPNEQAAMAAGGDAAGEYLESLGKIRPRDAEPGRVAAADRDRGHRLLRHPARARGQDRDRLDGMARRIPF